MDTETLIGPRRDRAPRRPTGAWTGSSALVLTALASLLLGCSKTDSDNVSSEGLRAEITVNADGFGETEVRAEIYVGSSGLFGATAVELSGGDVLTAFGNGEARRLRERNDLLGAAVWYTTRFGVDSPGTEFRIALERAGDAGAPSSTVLLPEPFGIDTPSGVPEFARDARIEVNWSPSGTDDSVRIEISSNCRNVSGSRVYRFGSEIATIDDGSYSLNAADLLGEPETDDGGCEVYLTVKRVRAGSLDPGYGEGGYIVGQQTRNAAFSIAPL